MRWSLVSASTQERQTIVVWALMQSWLHRGTGSLIGLNMGKASGSYCYNNQLVQQVLPLPCPV